MRVLFVPLAVQTHLYFQVPIAWALRSAGHEVRVATQPDLTEQITRAGLTAVPVGPPMMQSEVERRFPSLRPEELGLDTSDLSPDRLDYEYLHGLFTVITTVPYQMVCPDAMIEELVDFARWWRPDLVIWDEMTFAGPVAARAVGAAHARTLFGLDVMGRLRAPYLDLLARRPPELREDPMAEWLGWEARRYGAEFGEDMVVGERTISPVPPSLAFDVDLDYLHVGHMPYNGPAVVPEWLRRPPQRRRICLTLGHNHGAFGGRWVPLGELLEAVADLDVEVIATLREEQLAELPRVPANVRPVDFVPLDALLPSCAAIVHAGGGGTTLNAVVHGVPQLIIPSGVWGTGHLADALAARDAAVRLGGERVTAAEVRAQLHRLLDDPAVSAGADRLRQEVRRTPTPGEIVPALEKLAATHRSRPAARRAPVAR